MFSKYILFFQVSPNWMRKFKFEMATILLYCIGLKCGLLFCPYIRNKKNGVGHVSHNTSAIFYLFIINNSFYCLCHKFRILLFYQTARFSLLFYFSRVF